AVWPDDKSAANDKGHDKKHWAFQPVREPPLPKVKEPARIVTPVDAFILAKLDAAGLTQNPPADKRTLLRRLKFDLLGLPPTQQEIEEFIRNPDPAAYEKLVEHFLASPHYGERWARHWLDVARYADNKGYVFMEER